jgi:hypothetical protein
MLKRHEDRCGSDRLSGGRYGAVWSSGMIALCVAALQMKLRLQSRPRPEFLTVKTRNPSRTGLQTRRNNSPSVYFAAAALKSGQELLPTPDADHLALVMSFRDQSSAADAGHPATDTHEVADRSRTNVTACATFSHHSGLVFRPRLHRTIVDR